jgi:hypothetical protein
MPTLAVSGIAIASFVISLVALFASGGWAIYEHVTNGERDRRIETIETTKAEGIDSIRRAIEAGIDPAAAHERGAAISLFVHRAPSNRTTPELYLVVRNLGPGGALIRDIRAIDRPPNERTFTEKREVLPGGAVELLPGEEHYVGLVVTSSTPWPIEVAVTWVDGAKQQRERVRALVEPPSV